MIENTKIKLTESSTLYFKVQQLSIGRKLRTLFKEASQIKWALWVSCTQSPICVYLCLCENVYILCHQRASSLIPSSAFRLHVKTLHCSTASGISAGTAPFFSNPPHNREIKFGPDPSCVESSLLTHAHLPVFIRYAPESTGQLRAPKSLL